MRIKTIAKGMAALMVLSVGWKYKDAALVQEWLASSRAQARPAIQFDNDTPGEAPVSSALEQTARKRGLVGVRKCRQGETVVYTDGDCPAGSREFAVTGGVVTVVPAQSTLTVPASPSGRLPHARDVLLPDDGNARLHDKAMERVISR